MTLQPDDDVIIYECEDAWEIRIGAELHGLRRSLPSWAEAPLAVFLASSGPSIALWSCCDRSDPAIVGKR